MISRLSILLRHARSFAAPRNMSFVAALALSLSVFSSGVAGADPLSYNQTPFKLPIETASLTAVDLNGDGDLDLLAQLDTELRLYLQRDGGFDFDKDFISLPLSGRALGWDIGLVDAKGQPSLITLERGSEVLTYRLNETATAWRAPEILLSGVAAAIGSGVQRLHFVRDVNGDDRDDLVLPDGDRLALYLASIEGFLPPLRIDTQVRLDTTLFSPNLERRIGQALRIPPLRLRDVNGDLAADLIVDTDERLAVFLADPTAANYFSADPSFELDRLFIEESLGEFDIETLDFANLTGVLALTHEELLEDIDGDGIEDLLLREGGKVSVFPGTRAGIDVSTPTQVLRSGGNVLTTFLYDEDGDGSKDLWLWRVEPISVGDIFVWLALSGSISVEAFVYRNQGDAFARRPARKISVALKFPSVIRLASSLRQIADDARSAAKTTDTLTGLAQLDGSVDELIAEPSDSPLDASLDGMRVDLMLLMGNRLSLYLNVIEAAPAPTFLGALGYSADRDDYAIDLKAAVDAAMVSSNPLDGINSAPSLEIDFSSVTVSGGLVSARINQDNRDDIFVFTAMTPEAIEGILLLSD